MDKGALKKIDPERQRRTRGLDALLGQIGESIPLTEDLEVEFDVYDTVTLEHWN